MTAKIGQRLRLYRLLRKLSLDDLVDKMNGQISKMTLSKYEREIINPSEQNILLLAAALGASVNELTMPSRFSFKLLSFRKRSSLSKKSQEEIKASLMSSTEKILSLIDRSDPEYFTSVKPLPKFRVSSMIDAEDASNILREEWRLGIQPITNLTNVLEANNLLVIFECHDPKFDGFSAEVQVIDQEGPFGVIFCQKDTPGDRQRFSMAHELGHILLDVADNIKEEKAVNRFAGAFLLPRELMTKRVGSKRNLITYRELLKLKQETGVSIQAIIYRLRDLEIISQAHFEEWFQYLSFSGLRKQEEIQLPSETSTQLEDLALRALAEGFIDVNAAIEEFGIDAKLAHSMISRTQYFEYHKKKGGEL